jgi:hypothetical protein
MAEGSIQGVQEGLRDSNLDLAHLHVQKKAFIMDWGDGSFLQCKSHARSKHDAPIMAYVDDSQTVV